MRVIVEIVTGPSAGGRVELQSGQIGQVGRASWAELSLPNDRSMAGRHFAIECGLDSCTLESLTRDKPLFLNGTKVTKELLKDGDEIKAGDNTFRVRIESEAIQPMGPALPQPTVIVPAASAPLVPPTILPEPAEPKALATGVDLLAYLRKAQPLFAILDAARDDRVLELLRSNEDEYESLYEGPDAEELDVVAPYLVRLLPQSKLLEALAQDGWGNSWGVFLTSKQPFAEVRKHLRHFLKVESEGEEYLFRFYDPRVLRVFLPVCNAGETVQFFGPIDQFLTEAREPAALLKFTPLLQGVKEEQLPVTVR